MASIDARGVLNYPLLKKKIDIELTKEKETELENVLADVSSIINQDKPPEAEWKSYCRNCAYKELCWG
jgi:CRISPR-associated exonuclease Cas4